MAKELVAAIKPPKPISKMTDEERREFIKQLLSKTRKRLVDGAS
jgi:hypothetical protein